MGVTLFALIVAFFAGLTQGTTGFGLALVAAPCLLLFLPPAQVVPALVILSTFNSAFIAWEARRHIRLGLVVPLAIGGIVGSPLGTYALVVADALLMKVLVGAFVIVFGLVLLSGWRRPLRNTRRALFPVGFASGFLGGSTSMGGPPIVFFLANQGMPKDHFRGNLVCYFFAVDLFIIGNYLFTGLLNRSVLGFTATLLPSILLGTYSGVRLSRRVPETLFYRLAMAVVIVTGSVLFAVNVHKVAVR